MIAREFDPPGLFPWPRMAHWAEVYLAADLRALIEGYLRVNFLGLCDTPIGFI